MILKRNNLSPARVKIMTYFAMGVLLLMGFAEASNRRSIAQLQVEPLNLPVAMVQQSLGTSCGEAVIVMVYNFAFPATPISEAQVIEYAASQGYFTEGIPPYTSPVNMVNIARHYANSVDSGTVTNSNQGLSLLIQRLQDGEPVIIDVLSNFGDPESEAHFIVVTGISVDPLRENALIIHYNDPLTGTRLSADWLGETGVWNAWKNNGDPGGPGWWLVISPS
jgi:hypothetical protein